MADPPEQPLLVGGPDDLFQIRFGVPDLILLVVKLTNAITELTTAVGALSAEDKPATIAAIGRTGDLIDDVSSFVQRRMEEAVPVERG